LLVKETDMGLFDVFKVTPQQWLREAQSIERDRAAESVKYWERHAALYSAGMIGPTSLEEARKKDEVRRAAFLKVRQRIAGCVEKALAIDPSFGPALLAKGELATGSAQGCGTDALRDVEYTFGEGAAECFRKCVTVAPGLADAQFYRGRLHEGDNELDEALAAYERAVQLNPGDPEAWWGISRIHRKKGHAKDSEECAQKARQLGSQTHLVGYRWLYLKV